jgi:hypothetical protein
MSCGSTISNSTNNLKTASHSFPDLKWLWNIPLTWLAGIALGWERRHQGRSRVVTNAGRDAVDAAASARNGVAGRVSRERSTGVQTNGARRVRQNRVVPTPVAGAKLSVADAIQPDPISHQAGSDGDKTNSSPGRARHKP